MFCRSHGRIKGFCRNKQILKNIMIMICFWHCSRFFKLHPIIQFAFAFKLSHLTGNVSLLLWVQPSKVQHCGWGFRSIDGCLSAIFSKLKISKDVRSLKGFCKYCKSCKFALVCKCDIYHLCPILQLYFLVECFSSVNSIRRIFKEKGHLYWSHK